MREPRDILVLLSEADEAADEAQTFVLVYTGGGREVLARGWPDRTLAPSTEEVDDLEERRWVRVTNREGKGRAFAITAAGRDAALARKRQLAATAGTAVSLDWPAVSGVLDAFYEAYTGAGAPEHGIETEKVLRVLEDPAGARAAVRALLDGGYLEGLADVEQSDVPVTVRPTTATLQLLAGWPGGTAEAAFDELVADLDSAIDSAPDEQRPKLIAVRDGLLGAARDVALAYLEKRIGAS